MTHFIDSEYLLALWFYNNKKLIGSFEEINKYKVKIQEKLSKINYVVLYSSYYLDKCLYYNNDCFELIDKDYIRLKVPFDTILARFIAYIPNIVLNSVYYN